MSKRDTKGKGLIAPTTNPLGNNCKTKFTDNSSNNQCLKILDWLFEKGNITTTEARKHLDIMSPAARVLQLKQAGYLIITVKDTWASEHGIKHKGVARYVLTQNEPIESNHESEVAA
jgi:hypothetical protein